MKIHAREGDQVPVIDTPAYRSRRYLSAPETAGDLWSPSMGKGYGALRMFEDVLVRPGSSARVPAPEGLETVAYILDGACLLTDGTSPPTRLAADAAVHVLSNREARCDVKNESTTAPLRMVVGAVLSPEAKPRPAFDVRTFDDDGAPMRWLATPAGASAAQRVEATIPLGPSVRFGIAWLDSGVEIRFDAAVDRGLYIVVLDGNIELDQGFLGEGGDAHFPLESPTRLQGVTPARVAIFDVQLGFVKELF
jgi:hypothetical protein